LPERPARSVRSSLNLGRVSSSLIERGGPLAATGTAES
jgi:hypothetical protein